MKTPIPKCRGCYKPAVPADAGVLKSIPYWYCRTCKIEVDEWGMEVAAKMPEGLEELEDYLSGEIGRFDNESPLVAIYDPFLKRTRKVFRADLKYGQPLPPPIEEEEDDEILGFYEPNCQPETF